MTRLWPALIALVLSGTAQAAAPDFNTDHFCSDFAQRSAGNMPEMAKAVCMMSEESTKAVVVGAWDHAPAAGRDACVKSAGDSYVSLAKCLKGLPGQ
ncbi:MAG TPA: hypothetical protein VFL53_02020 [Pseudolabrys sp.]|nr:hypothetical protein [Pseudolabrys sp.]